MSGGLTPRAAEQMAIIQRNTEAECAQLRAEVERAWRYADRRMDKIKKLEADLAECRERL